MLNLSEILLTPLKSNLFIRFSCFVFLVTVFFICTSGLPLVIKCLLVCFLCYQITAMIRSGKPHPDFEVIHFVNQEWTLVGSEEMVFENCYTLLNAPFFQLLRFKNTDSKRFLYVLFKDQVDEAALKKFNLILKLKTK